MASQFILSSPNATTHHPTKHIKIPLGENSTENSSPNCFPNETEASEPMHVQQNTSISPHKQDSAEPQYSFHKVSSFGSLYRLSQVSLLSHTQSPSPNGHISKSPNGHISKSIGQHTHCRDSIDQYIDVISDADIVCVGKNISDCIGLQRIISILVFYKNNYNNLDSIEQYLDVYNMNKHLINDYHHIIDKHLNEDHMSAHKSNKQFSLIYQTLLDAHLYCEIETCHIWSRNQRQRESDITHDVFVDILDGIHCYFMHSIDIGYRIIENKSEQKQNCTIKDSDLVHLRGYLGTKVQQIQQKSSRFSTNLAQLKRNVSNGNGAGMEGYLKKESKYWKQLRLRYMVLSGDTLQSYKTHKKLELTETVDLKQYNHIEISAEGPIGQFELVMDANCKKKRVLVASTMAELDCWLKAFKQCIGDINNKQAMIGEKCENNSEKLNQQSFGERYDYWSANRIYPKYESIKEEVTSNRIFNLSMDAFNAAFNKSKHLINSCDKIRNMMTCSNAEVLHKYNLKYDAVIRIDHILALVLWTDYRTLAKEFRSTFTKISKKIYDEFWIWSKFLIEAVNAFGQRLKKAKVKTCFHCVTPAQYIYTSFDTTFNVPTSATAKLQICLLNAPKDNDGLILELGHNDQRFSKKMRYFNCAFVSCFAFEEERLFIQPPMNNYYFHIISIRNLRNDMNYGKYIQSIDVLQRVFSNRFKMNSEIAIDTEMVSGVVSYLCEKEKCDIFLPKYVQSICDEWSRTVQNITFDSYESNKIVPNLCNSDIVRFDKLNVMFPNLKCIYIDSVSSKYAQCNEWKLISEMVRNVSKSESSQLREIYIIHREYGSEFERNWDAFEALIEDSDSEWRLVDVEGKAVCITRAE